MKAAADKLVWVLVALLGAGAMAVVALSRGEHVNAMWLVIAAACTYLIAYRFYGLFIATKVLRLDRNRHTPAVLHNDALDYVPVDNTCCSAITSPPSPAPGRWSDRC